MAPVGTQQRGSHLLDAALGLLAEEGFAALTMRSVAARADVSLAQVQYYFRTKAELVAAAFDHAGNQFLASLHTVAAGEPSLERLRRIVWLWLPLDPEREKRARVWLAYAATAATETSLAAANTALDADLRAWFAEQLDVLQHAGQIHPRLDTVGAAAQLLALIDGVTVHCLVLPIGDRPALVDRVLGAWIDHLTGPA